jgi:hypothetical protein
MSTELRDPARRLFAVECGRNAIAETDAAWENEHILRTRCPGCRDWRRDVPYEPIEAVLRKPPRALITTTGLFKVVDADLVETILPYGRGIMVGPVRLARTGETLPRWRTMYGTREACLEVDRGRYSRHGQCRVCGRILRRNWWAHPVVVERYLDDRWLYLDGTDSPFVDERLVDREALRERFAALRFYPVPIVPEPLDGEVLPGDPGWTGTLRKLPIPEPPQTRPVKGIGLWL